MLIVCMYVCIQDFQFLHRILTAVVFMQLVLGFSAPTCLYSVMKTLRDDTIVVCKGP